MSGREVAHQELYWDIFRQMVHADEVGFDTYALIEHHFFRTSAFQRIR